MTRSRLLPSLAAVALVAGCGSPPAANEAAAAPPPPKAVSDGYESCRNRAEGDAPALVKCADDAIAAAGAKVDGAQGGRDFKAALQAIGDQSAAGEGQSGQVVFADRAVTLARARAALLSGGAAGDAGATAPSLTGDAEAAWAKSRASACAEHKVPRCTARYDALLRHLPAGALPMTQGLPLPTCAEIKAANTPTGELVDAFDARFPKDLKGEDSVETVALDPAALDNVVGYVTCVAGLTSFDVTVAEDSLALFASKRHGAAALARLDALAAAGGELAPAARTFRKQIGDYLKGPGA